MAYALPCFRLPFGRKETVTLAVRLKSARTHVAACLAAVFRHTHHPGNTTPSKSRKRLKFVRALLGWIAARQYWSFLPDERGGGGRQVEPRERQAVASRTMLRVKEFSTRPGALCQSQACEVLLRTCSRMTRTRKHTCGTREAFGVLCSRAGEKPTTLRQVLPGKPSRHHGATEGSISSKMHAPKKPTLPRLCDSAEDRSGTSRSRQVYGMACCIHSVFKAR